MQAQLQALLAAQGEAAVLGTGTSTEVAKPQVFDGTTEKVLGFITVCKLYIRIRMRRDTVEEQI